MQLANWYPSRGVRTVGEAGNIYRRTLKAAQGWEAPRPPFDVTFHLTLCVPTTTGRQEEGEVYFSTAGGEPITAALGSGQLPLAVEAALGSMVRGDVAVVACPAAALQASTLLPGPPAEERQQGSSGGGGGNGWQQADWLEFSVQLLDFLQVRDMTGDGQVRRPLGNALLCSATAAKLTQLPGCCMSLIAAAAVPLAIHCHQNQHAHAKPLTFTRYGVFSRLPSPAGCEAYRGEGAWGFPS